MLIENSQLRERIEELKEEMMKYENKMKDLLYVKEK